MTKGGGVVTRDGATAKGMGAATAKGGGAMATAKGGGATAMAKGGGGLCVGVGRGCSDSPGEK